MCVLCRYLAMTSIDEANGWYGGTLLAEQDESSEVYRHYAQFCQVSKFLPSFFLLLLGVI